MHNLVAHPGGSLTVDGQPFGKNQLDITWNDTAQTFTFRRANNAGNALFVDAPAAQVQVEGVPSSYGLTKAYILANFYLASSGGDTPAPPTGEASLDVPHVFNVKSYGAKGDGIVLIDGVITAGSNIITSASAHFKQADVGKLFKFQQAAANGKTMVGVITAVPSEHSVQVSVAATQNGGNCLLVYGTNDQDAFILASAAAKEKGGFLYSPLGHYCLPPNLVHDDGNGNDPDCLITLPSQGMLAENEDGTYRAIGLIGEAPTPNFDGPFVDSQSDRMRSGVVMEAFMTYEQMVEQATTDWPSVIGTRGPVNQFGSTNLSDIFFKNITVRRIFDPEHGTVLSGFNLAFAGNANVKNCTALTDVSVARIMQAGIGASDYPSVGFISTYSNQGTQVFYENNVSVGNHLNYSFGEHIVAIGNQGMAGLVDIDFQKGSHLSTVISHVGHWNKIGFTFNGVDNPYVATQAAQVSIMAHRIERYPIGPMAFVADVDDPTNALRGNVFYAGGTSQASNIGDYAFTKVGGQYLTANHIAHAVVTNDNLAYWLSQIQLEYTKMLVGTGDAEDSNSLAVVDDLGIAQSVDGGLSIRNLNPSGYGNLLFKNDAGAIAGQVIVGNTATPFGGSSALADNQLHFLSLAGKGLAFANTQNAPHTFAIGGTEASNIREQIRANGHFIVNSAEPPTPDGGGMFYVEAGALKYKGSGGTVTTLAEA